MPGACSVDFTTNILLRTNSFIVQNMPGSINVIGIAEVWMLVRVMCLYYVSASVIFLTGTNITFILPTSSTQFDTAF